MSIIQHLCRDLDDVKDRHRSTWNREADIELLGAQLNIYAFQLQKLSPAQHSSPPGSLEVGTAKKALIHLGLSTAVRIIHVFSTMTEGGSAQPSPQADGSFQTDPHHPERYLPKYYFMTLSFATSFMFKALANNGEDFRHNEIARNHIQLAYQMFSSWSDYPMDEFGRVARMIMVLSRASNLSILEDFHSQGDASVSVLDETIHAAKEIRERMKMPDLTRSTGSQDRIPVSPRPNLSNPTLPGLGGLWPTQNLDGMEEFDFNWNSPWGFNMTALGYPGFGLDEEAC
ncbi:hypothetical protein LIPSTDRAFT_66714 [Lipomyces starkeyi NRRL Y-11557]|uniref:Uncharacterized protein n=1 Tax=Lipomyces starkeyi NRRL Y-11557 TaxID=675824 RepID=A0A1E3PUT1_LIPST|nr:hypothetical protein LIPSTDRAFT_66714 [Lipomyces starkeyi NRRL Y-11557]